MRNKANKIALSLNSVALISCAVFNLTIHKYISNSTLLIILMLFLPLLDSNSILPKLNFSKKKLIIWIIYLLLELTLIIFNNEFINIAIGTIILTALPEEWFFRGYFMMQIRRMRYKAHQANIVTSLFFTLLHLPSQGALGLLVFIPSFAFGWIFNRTQDIILVILLHALSNTIFYIYCHH